MDLKGWLKRLTSPHPRVIECSALVVFVLVVVAGMLTLCRMPAAEFKRSEILPVIDVLISGFGVAALLFLWAQLRHSATLSKLLAYHDYFQELPKESKVRTLYTALGRVNLKPPLWQTPLSPEDTKVLLADTTAAPDSAASAAREYLNDFEEFSAAVNCGLVDENYAYHIESARALNAYYGFSDLINHWLAEDQQRATRDRAAGVAPSDYYGELKKLAERWKERKVREMKELERHRRGIGGIL